MSLLIWVGIKTARELPECETILSTFGYIKIEHNPHNTCGYLWINAKERSYLYSTVNANATDMLIEVCDLAHTLLLVDLGVIE